MVLSYTVKHTRIVPVVSFEETGAIKARVDCYMQKNIWIGLESTLHS